jgi:hypothetical protein
MKEIRDKSGMSPSELEALARQLEGLESLADVLRWGRNQPAGVVKSPVITEVVVQDEFTHDAIVP